jgi:hypothetical protein
MAASGRRVIVITRVLHRTMLVKCPRSDEPERNSMCDWELLMPSAAGVHQFGEFPRASTPHAFKNFLSIFIVKSRRFRASTVSSGDNGTSNAFTCTSCACSPRERTSSAGW